MYTEEFCLTEHKLQVDLCGLSYYAQENGLFVPDEEDAFTRFTKSAVERIKSNLAVDPQIVVTITETNTAAAE